MKNILIAISFLIGTSAGAKTMKIDNISAALSLRFSGGLERYFRETKGAEKGIVQIFNGAAVLKIYNSPECVKGETCEELSYVVHETQLPLAQIERFSCGNRKYGIRYEAQTPANARAMYYEKITVIDSSQCPKSDRGVGYVTYSVEGRRGNAMIQFFIDDVYRD